MEDQHENSTEYDVFLTHDWNTDEKGRNNHERVSIINRELKLNGYVTWFDQERMTGRIRQQMTKGIDHSKCVIVFLTKAYMEKVNHGRRNDNVLFEMNYAFDKHTVELLAVCMDDTMCNHDKWSGELKGMLGLDLFVCMNGDLDDGSYLQMKMKELIDQLRRKKIKPSLRTIVCERDSPITYLGLPLSPSCPF